MTRPQIDTPRGKIFIGPNGKAELKWKINFSFIWELRFSKAQKFVDSETLRLCEPYIPLDTSMLIKSGILGTVIGEGEVKWIAPYAVHQYYSTRAPGRLTGPLRGPYWFERMKETHGAAIIAGARKLAGGKTAEMGRAEI